MGRFTFPASSPVSKSDDHKAGELVQVRSPNAFEFKGTNGFLLTFDMTWNDITPSKPSMRY